MTPEATAHPHMPLRRAERPQERPNGAGLVPECTRGILCPIHAR